MRACVHANACARARADRVVVAVEFSLSKSLRIEQRLARKRARAVLFAARQLACTRTRTGPSTLLALTNTEDCEQTGETERDRTRGRETRTQSESGEDERAAARLYGEHQHECRGKQKQETLASRPSSREERARTQILGEQLREGIGAVRRLARQKPLQHASLRTDTRARRNRSAEKGEGKDEELRLL
eukprot:6040372-Pleurochrysis_carterae.AAC.2